MGDRRDHQDRVHEAPNEQIRELSTEGNTDEEVAAIVDLSAIRV